MVATLSVYPVTAGGARVRAPGEGVAGAEGTAAEIMSARSNLAAGVQDPGMPCTAMPRGLHVLVVHAWS